VQKLQTENLILKELLQKVVQDQMETIKNRLRKKINFFLTKNSDMRTENQENYGLSERNFQTNESPVNEPQMDESTSYVDQYENISNDNDDPEEEPIVNEEDAITNDQDNLDQQFLDALQEDDDEEEIYDDQNNLDKNQNSLNDADPDDNDLADNDLNDLEGDHLNNPDLDREEQNIRNRDASKID